MSDIVYSTIIENNGVKTTNFMPPERMIRVYCFHVPVSIDRGILLFLSVGRSVCYIRYSF